MYDPWYSTDSSTAEIIRLIEEKERKESKNAEGTDNWDIMRLRDVPANEKAKTSRFVDLNSTRRPGRPEQSERSVPTAEGSRRRGAAPAGRSGKAVAESLDKQPRDEGDTVEWKVNRRSNSPEERNLVRSRRGQRSPDPKMKRNRSRSGSADRWHKRRHSRSRSGSPKKRPRSRSNEAKRDRSGSREKRRHGSVSRDRKHKKSDQRPSSSNDTEKRDPSPSPRKHTKTTQSTPDSSAIADMFAQFNSIMNDLKEKLAQSDKKEVPDHKVNVLPEFDPNNKGHAMVTWLIRVDDVAKLFGWNEKEILEHSLPKLVGDAKTWYQTLTTVPFSWSEWKKMLLEQFPCPKFAELLMEMSNRHALPTETLEQYFYAKVTLLNRCGFKGRQAVDCLLQGIETDAIRLCARAADYAEPEEVLVYLKSAESLRQIPKTITEPLPPPPETTSTTTTATANTGQNAPKEKKKHICFICGLEGHKGKKCIVKYHNQATYIRPPFAQMNPAQHHMSLISGPRPRPIKQIRPENQYCKSIFVKRCHKCKQIGHLALMCRAKKRKEAAEAAEAGPPQDSVENQPAPPGIED